MRLRLKKHLNERCNSAMEYLIDCGELEPNHKIANANKAYLNTAEIFGNDNPLNLEIGCGMGGFAVGFCNAHPDENLIGIELIKNVIVVAMEKAKENDLKNARFMNMTAEYLLKFFKEKSVDKIFLNFSTPYPKEKQRNKRLTHPRFLEEYMEILKEDGEIWQKTDDREFFEYSLESLENNGFEVYERTYDLHRIDDPENVVTEYESKFTSIGKPICRLKARKRR